MSEIVWEPDQQKPADAAAPEAEIRRIAPGSAGQQRVPRDRLQRAKYPDTRHTPSGSSIGVTVSIAEALAS